MHIELSLVLQNDHSHNKYTPACPTYVNYQRYSDHY